MEEVQAGLDDAFCLQFAARNHRSVVYLVAAPTNIIGKHVSARPGLWGTVFDLVPPPGAPVNSVVVGVTTRALALWLDKQPTGVAA